MAQWRQIQLGAMRLWVRSLVLLSGLRIQCCHGLWCGSQMRLRSGVAVAAQAGSWTPSLRTSIYHGCSPKKKKGQKRQKKTKTKNYLRNKYLEKVCLSKVSEYSKQETANSHKYIMQMATRLYVVSFHGNKFI